MNFLTIIFWPVTMKYKLTQSAQPKYVQKKNVTFIPTKFRLCGLSSLQQEEHRYRFIDGINLFSSILVFLKKSYQNSRFSKILFDFKRAGRWWKIFNPKDVPYSFYFSWYLWSHTLNSKQLRLGNKNELIRWR